MSDLPSSPAARSFLARLIGRGLRDLQRLACYRRLARRLRPMVAIAGSERADPRLAERATLLEATCGGRPVGQGSLLYHPVGYPPEPDWWIVSVAVKPTARGRGIGEAVCLEALRLARQAGAREVGALVHRDNAPSLALFGKLGFQEDRTSPFPTAWAAQQGVEDVYLLLRRTLSEDDDALAPGAGVRAGTAKSW